MERRSFLSSLLGIPLLARFLPVAEKPKVFWAGTTVPRTEVAPGIYQYTVHYVNAEGEIVNYPTPTTWTTGNS